MTSTQECSTGIQCSIEDTTTTSSTISSVTQIVKTKFNDQHLATDDPDDDLEEDNESEEDFEKSLHQIRHTTTVSQENPKQTTPEEVPPTPEEPSEIRMQRDDSKAFSNYFKNHNEPNNYGHQIYYPYQVLPKPEKLVDQRVPNEAT